MGRIIIHPGQETDEDEPEETMSLTPEQARELLRARAAALTRQRVRTPGPELPGGGRGDILGLVNSLIAVNELALAGCLLELVHARDHDMEVILETYLREIMIASGRDGAWEQACRECGCTNESACAGGCEWIDSDLCSTCFAKMFPRSVIVMPGGA